MFPYTSFRPFYVVFSRRCVRESSSNQAAVKLKKRAEPVLHQNTSTRGKREHPGDECSASETKWCNNYKNFFFYY